MVTKITLFVAKTRHKLHFLAKFYFFYKFIAEMLGDIDFLPTFASETI